MPFDLLGYENYFRGRRNKKATSPAQGPISYSRLAADFVLTVRFSFHSSANR